MSDVLTDILLHLSECILHVTHLVRALALLHQLIHLTIGHTMGFIYQLLQRLQLAMGDEETEQSQQQQTDETDDDGIAQK